LNVTIHHQWASFFTLHMDLKSQNFNYNDASFDKSNSNSEELHCTPTYSMIHNFLDAKKKWIMKVLYIILPQVNIFTL